MDADQSVDTLRLPWESDDRWMLRKAFLERHWDAGLTVNRLVCLSQAFINMEFLGCRYNKQFSEQVVAMAAGLANERREERKKVVEKTFIKATEKKQTYVGRTTGKKS